MDTPRSDIGTPRLLSPLGLNEASRVVSKTKDFEGFSLGENANKSGKKKINETDPTSAASLATTTSRQDWGIDYFDSERLTQLKPNELVAQMNHHAQGQDMEQRIPSQKIADDRNLAAKKERHEFMKKQKTRERKKKCCVLC